MQARLLDLPPFAKMSLHDQLATALGNPPPSLLKKDDTIWIERVIPVSSRFAGALRRHLSAAKVAHPPRTAGHICSQGAQTPASTSPGASSNPGGQAIPPTSAAGESESSASDDDTACEVCGASDDAPKMLLCDQCDHGYHLYCLSPPLPRVPAALWYCPQCTPNAATLQGPSPAPKQSPPDHAPAHPPKRTRSQTAGISGPLPHDRQVALGAPGTVGPNHRPVSPPCESVGNPTLSPTPPLPCRSAAPHFPIPDPP